MVKRVGERISAAVEKFLAEHGKADLVRNYNGNSTWLKDPSANAWAMPGGKVVVYTGIWISPEIEAGLATVMGHEIAHAVAQHGNERMSQGC